MVLHETVQLALAAFQHWQQTSQGNCLLIAFDQRSNVSVNLYVEKCSTEPLK